MGFEEKKVRVKVIGTGGTIASVPTERGWAPRADALDVVRETLRGEILGGMSVSCESLMNIDSSLMVPEHWVRIAESIFHEHEKYDAFLVLHGTDTMAYTASALSFALRNLKKPVVLTGAMRSFSEKNSDAPSNLRASLRFIRVAVASGISGVFVVFNNKVILGVRASKISATDFDAFTSVNYPYVAFVGEGGVVINHVPRRSTGDGPLELSATFNDNIVVFKVFPGMRPSLLDLAISSGVDGIVLETFGLGGLSGGLIEKLREVSDRIPVVIIGQPVFGGVNLSVYEVGRRLLETKVIPAYDMSKECAIVKLMWVLGKTRELDEVKRLFLKSFEDEIASPGLEGIV